MRRFIVTTAHGESVVKVPKGKSLADVGYPGDVVLSKTEVPREPREHERLCPKRKRLVRDDAAAAEEALRVRGRRLGRGGLLAMIEELEGRVKALEEKKAGE